MAKQSVTVRLEPSQVKRLDLAVEILGGTRTVIIEEALETHLALLAAGLITVPDHRNPGPHPILLPGGKGTPSESPRSPTPRDRFP